ncbi:hypothetical protein NEMBOFW57_003491 [Staphylotrichum longicolle]|uniref:C2H2-type domain-containing protein n=1 Tax=Staphylotrichum longicolle TaxID=669026 RepID=A0AAD4F518_9PEZI|nr:hypothetical protein NEMBOFW57_003491 [Staphylotrichum longicolle]
MSQPQPQPTLNFISTNPLPTAAATATATATSPLQEPQEPQQPQQPQSPDQSPEDLQLEPSSPASSDLHATRPNRWRGHPSTWKTWTETDRQVWTALENARKADLAVHLYNAAGLRRGWRRGPDVDALGQDGDESTGWDIGKAWTAWPVKAREVPDDAVLPRTADVNEPFTLRREQGGLFAGQNLEEEISATMLRFAKERFQRRELQGKEGTGETVVPSIEKGDGTATEGETDASATEGGGDRDDEEANNPPQKTPQRKRRPASPVFMPVVSADDDRSYALLRPAARRTMAKLDDTLMILHNQRVAGLGHMSESSASDEDETDAEDMSERPSRVPTPKKRTGRPKKINRERLLARWGLRDWRDALGAAALAGFSPAVIARATQRCSTLFREEMTMHTLHEQSAIPGRAGLETVRYVPGRSIAPSSDEEESEEELLQLRMVSRQSSVRLTGASSPEPEPGRSRSGTPAARFCPHPGCPRAVEPFNKKSNFERHIKTVHGGSMEPAKMDLGEVSEPGTPTKRRSRSGTPAAAFFCHYPNCPRATDGFNQRKNLARHLQTMHGKRAAPSDDEEDSADEMDGGVHVDRFLQPIKIRKGWRGDDFQQRLTRARKRIRAGSEELDSAFL